MIIVQQEKVNCEDNIIFPQTVSPLRKLACRIRSWFYFHIKWRGKVKYTGFVRVMKGTKFERSGITIGNNVQFGPNCLILAQVEFHNNILMASNVAFIGKNDHCFDVPCQTIWNGQRGNDGKTIVEDDVWIGHGAIILAGVKVGKGSILAAGSVLTKDIPPCEIWGGNPARKLKDRFIGEESKLQHLRWLELNSNN